MQAEQERLRSEGDRMREQGDKIREESREYMNSGDYNRALEDALKRELETPRAYTFMAPRMGMTEEMVEEGLVQPGEEADVILTPDKLKINGKKMPENIHQKYLRMYEQQQGVELSGNSRVEFKTKSRRSM
ncbi:MAG: hypothetical protein IPP15_12325 [Saprospiraceae bacterium]|nr:hypothetical protein [Candidatus Opimibacter skivensis]